MSIIYKHETVRLPCRRGIKIGGCYSASWAQVKIHLIVRFAAPMVNETDAQDSAGTWEMNTPELSTCFGCGALLEEREGPTHRYLESSPACWALYGEVLAREYSHPELMDIHRLSVDAYAVQHPGRESLSTINSAAIHLLRLCLILEQGLPITSANDAIKALAEGKRRYYWLTPPSSRGAITVLDVSKAASIEDHRRAVREWATSAWQAWTRHHAVIRKWLPPNLNQKL